MTNLNESTSIDSLKSTTTVAVIEETLFELNMRYAEALLPLTILLGVMALLGVIGNVLVLYVYGTGKQFRDKNFRSYVLFLAVVDLTTCVSLIPAEMLKHRNYFDFEGNELCKVKCFFNVFGASASAFCLLVVAVDRYLMVCHPMTGVRLRSVSSGLAKKLCVLVFVLGLVVTVPAPIMCGTSRKSMRNLAGNVTTVFICEAEEKYEKTIWRYIYRYTLSLLQTIVSIVMIALYIKIGRTIQQKRRSSVNAIQFEDIKGRRPSPNAKPLPSNVKLLFVVTLIFVVSYFFYIGLSFVKITKMTPVVFVVFSFFYRLYFVHSIINPLLYIKMDKRFRKTCLQFLRIKKFEKKSSLSISNCRLRHK